MSDDESRDHEGLRKLATAAQCVPDGSFDAAGDYEPGDAIADTEYVVRSRIGRGGHATVYECENSIGRVVAVKVIRRDLAKSPELLEGMVAEARRHVVLRHPKIVEVYRAGVTRGSRPLAYIEMERLCGGNGRQLLSRKERVRVPHALDILIDVCDALAVAHGKGIVHQDIKPDNIFIHFDEDTGKAITKLLDFGVARIVGQAYNQSFEGTLAYAAPEQLEGNTVSPLSDLYALAVVMFEFLTGRRPFEEAEADDKKEQDLHHGSTTASRADEFAFCKHLVDAKTLKSAPRVGDIAEDLVIPRELEGIVASLLEREPDNRILPHEAKRGAEAAAELERDVQSSTLPEKEIKRRKETAKPRLATASELAKRLRMIRATPGLEKGNLTTQQLLMAKLRPQNQELVAPVAQQESLLGASRVLAQEGHLAGPSPASPAFSPRVPEPSRPDPPHKGHTLRMQIVPLGPPPAMPEPRLLAPDPIRPTPIVAAVENGASPVRAWKDEADTVPDQPLFGPAAAEPPLANTVVDGPFFTPPPEVAHQPALMRPRRSDPLGYVAEPVRTNPISVFPTRERGAEPPAAQPSHTFDAGPPTPGKIVGTFEPVTDPTGRTRAPSPTARDADEDTGPAHARYAPRKISRVARLFAFASVGASFGLGVAATVIMLTRHLHPAALVTVPVAEPVPRAVTRDPPTRPTTSPAAPMASPSLPPAPVTSVAAPDAGAAAPSVSASIARAQAPSRATQKPNEAPKGTSPLAGDYEPFLSTDGGGSSQPPSPPARKAPPKAAPSASAHDDIEDWLEKPQKKTTPGPGF